MRPLIALLLCLALPANAEGFITRLLNKPVPGGVAVVDLGEGSSAPQARYQGKPVLVVKEEGRRWIAIVGIPLTVKPGTQQIEANGQALSFTVGPKHYREQRITLKNQEQVNPSPANLKRIERELAEQTRAYQQFSPRQPSNLLFDKPVDGPLSSPFGLRRFFNGEERNPHSGLDFAVGAGTLLRGGAALALSIVNPLAALLPLIETGGGEDSDCKAALAPVAGALHQAQEPAKTPPAPTKRANTLKK